LLQALSDSPNRLYADALLLLRETGLRIGELCDLELDCVHEIPGQGAWMKVPLGKLLTERMVPIDEETVELIDRIAIERSPGRPLRHPRSGSSSNSSSPIKAGGSRPARCVTSCTVPLARRV